jgi:hypothetical protein
MTSIKYCWRLFCFFPLVLFAQSDIDSLTEDNLARMKWSPELNETSCYYPHNSFSCILRNDSSILAMRQEDEYHSVEITVLDSNLTRKCSYNLNKKNKEFFKSRRVLGFAYQNQIPYLISINLGPTNELQAIPVSDNCSVDANSTIEISSGQFDKSSEHYLDFFKDVSKLKYTAFKQCTSQNGEYNFYLAHEFKKGYHNFNNHRFYLLVLNKNLELVHFSKQEYRNSEWEFLIESFLVSNEGVAFISFNCKEGAAMFGKKIKSTRKLYIGDHDKASQFELKHKNKYIQSASIVNVYENEVRLIYVLANEPKYGEKMTSLEFYSLNRSGEADFINEINASEFEIDDNLDNKKCDFQKFKPHSLHRLSDGSYYFLLEEYDQIESFSEMNGSKMYFLGYVKFYGDIFICKLDNKLNLESKIYFDKANDFGSPASSNYGGTLAFLTGNKLGLLYNILNEKRTSGYLALFERNRYSLYFSVSDGKYIEPKLLYEPAIKACNFKPFAFSKPVQNKILFFGNNIVVNGDFTDKTKYGLFSF